MAQGGTMDYLNTPSFYNNEEFFNRYLGRTSYYLRLPDVVSKVIGVTDVKSVLEFGSALGTTMLMLADKYKSIAIQINSALS